MGTKKKRVLHEYENKGHKAVGSISPEKERQVKSFKEYARKMTKRKGKILLEKESEEE